MTDTLQERRVWASYNERWRDWTDVLGELTGKLADPEHAVKNDTVINQVHRAVLAIRNIRAHYPKGSRIIDAACGPGFLTCFLRREGYDAAGFDFSPVAIEKAKGLAAKLGQPESMFTERDHSYLGGLQDDSVDVALAMGYLRYVSGDVRDYVYQHFHRALRAGGRLMLTHTNRLFALFALNTETLRFWAENIEDFSGASGLLEGRSTLDALRAKVALPERKYPAHSVSKQIVTHEENPLLFGETARQYGFELEHMYYPDPHLLPPFLEQDVDRAALEAMKGKFSLQRASDWRSMFMSYEFLAILRKT